MNLTYFQPRKRRIVENNNSPLNIRFVAKTSDIRNFSQNIRSDVETSEVTTLPTTTVTWSEPLLPCFCYAIKANFRNIRTQVLQPASVGNAVDLVNSKLIT